LPKKRPYQKPSLASLGTTVSESPSRPKPRGKAAREGRAGQGTQEAELGAQITRIKWQKGEGNQKGSEDLRKRKLGGSSGGQEKGG